MHGVQLHPISTVFLYAHRDDGADCDGGDYDGTVPSVHTEACLNYC